jgi:hypothetical protein
MLLTSGSLGRGVAIALAALSCALWVPSGDAREHGPAFFGSVQRVTKRGAGSARHIYWVELEGQQATAQPPRSLYVGALPPELEAGDRFDIVDAHGYVGRVTISQVESRPLACPGSEYRRGFARFDGPIDREPSTPAVAIGPVGRVPHKARIIMPEEVKGPQPPSRQDTLDRLLIDMDGDDLPDLMRHYYYCPSSAQGGRMAFCFEIWARAGGKWRMVEDTRIDNCY